MRSVSECAKVADACCPKTCRIAGNVFLDCLINRGVPVSPERGLAYRRENVPYSLPHSFGRFLILLKSVRKERLPVLGYAGNLSAGTRA